MFDRPPNSNPIPSELDPVTLAGVYENHGRTDEAIAILAKARTASLEREDIVIALARLEGKRIEDYLPAPKLSEMARASREALGQLQTMSIFLSVTHPARRRSRSLMNVLNGCIVSDCEAGLELDWCPQLEPANKLPAPVLGDAITISSYVAAMRRCHLAHMDNQDILTSGTVRPWP